jgi:hypothetical protein
MSLDVSHDPSELGSRRAPGPHRLVFQRYIDAGQLAGWQIVSAQRATRPPRPPASATSTEAFRGPTTLVQIP